MRRRAPQDVRVLVVGATGYIGKFVVKELISRGYQVVAFAREKSGVDGKQSMDDTRKARVFDFKGIILSVSPTTSIPLRLPSLLREGAYPQGLSNWVFQLF